MQTSACELLPDTAWTRTLGCLGWKDSTGVGKRGTPQVGLGKHEMRDSERQRFGPQLPAWLCVCWKPWQDRMWAVHKSKGGRETVWTPVYLQTVHLSGPLDIPECFDVPARGCQGHPRVPNPYAAGSPEECPEPGLPGNEWGLDTTPMRPQGLPNAIQWAQESHSSSFLSSTKDCPTGRAGLPPSQIRT